ncbi:hypothetical protein G3480_12485 [Thiorhodococcus mannitoliphagus]|uniref:DUF1289 domain-containing protein n=1 Tax=Thiorhodococcus mannitoliphagus TaxID=329406 RepID=A0A6P1DTI8_9GAMM|nr:hypothetical protein [Thiorhodococcus mannitoliphagus]NEX21119.1 hypothetical protein [Thiorhodococcus mannitoliphagus]
MARFEPCQGKNACRDDGERCLTCGRELSEIARLRDAVDALANLAIEHDYDNSEAFAAYVARKLFKTINYRREQHR